MSAIGPNMSSRHGRRWERSPPERAALPKGSSLSAERWPGFEIRTVFPDHSSGLSCVAPTDHRRVRDGQLSAPETERGLMHYGRSTCRRSSPVMPGSRTASQSSRSRRSSPAVSRSQRATARRRPRRCGSYSAYSAARCMHAVAPPSALWYYYLAGLRVPSTSLFSSSSRALRSQAATPRRRPRPRRPTLSKSAEPHSSLSDSISSLFGSTSNH